MDPSIRQATCLPRLRCLLGELCLGVDGLALATTDTTHNTGVLPHLTLQLSEESMVLLTSHLCLAAHVLTARALSSTAKLTVALSGGFHGELKVRGVVEHTKSELRVTGLLAFVLSLQGPVFIPSLLSGRAKNAVAGVLFGSGASRAVALLSHLHLYLGDHSIQSATTRPTCSSTSRLGQSTCAASDGANSRNTEYRGMRRIGRCEHRVQLCGPEHRRATENAGSTEHRVVHLESLREEGASRICLSVR